MNEPATDRLTRMLAMVAYLRDNPGVPVSEVAEHFGITEAQVLADVNTLWVSGTPGYMHGDLIDFAGDDLEHGVLTLLDPRDMDRPLRLSPGEAIALLVALQSLAAVLGPQDAALVEETAAALRAAAGQAAQAADAVELGVRRRDVEARVGQVRDALSEGRRLHLRYVSASDQTTERDVDPLQLLTDSQHWFLVGWCHRAQDVRQFRARPHPGSGGARRHRRAARRRRAAGVGRARHRPREAGTARALLAGPLGGRAAARRQDHRARRGVDLRHRRGGRSRPGSTTWCSRSVPT